jgi:micrococcal nuclease
MYFGPEAAGFTRESTLGKQVTVYLDEGSTRGKYGRLLAYVKLPDGRFLNEALLSEGFAYADLRFRHSFYNKYRQLEAAARGQKKGLWLKVTPEQMPKWRQSR